MAVRASSPSHRWVEFAAGTVLVVAAVEELAYIRHRLARQARSWWEDYEHREHYGMERSTLDALALRILFRRPRP